MVLAANDVHVEESIVMRERCKKIEEVKLVFAPALQYGSSAPLLAWLEATAI